MRRLRAFLAVAGLLGGGYFAYLQLASGGAGSVGPARTRDGRGRFGREGLPAAALQNFTLDREYDFGPSAGGSAPAHPTFAGDANLAYLFTVQSDCTVKCTTDDIGTSCAGITWAGGTGATCRQTWTGDWALTDVTDAKCWTFSGVTRSPANIFTSDFALSVFGYATSKESAFGMLMQIYDTGGGAGSNGLYLRNESGAVNAVWFESGAFPTAVASTSSYNGFNLTTGHRLGTAHNININGFSENTAVTASNAMTAGGTISGGIGCDNTLAGRAMGGQWVWAAVYKANKTTTQAGAIALAAVGYASPTAGLDLSGTSSNLCYDNADGGPMDCLLGLPYVDARGFRAVKGETTTSKWSSDPLNLSTATAENSPGLVANVKAGPLFELTHTNEMDRIIDADATNFAGYKGGNSYVRVTSNYSVCAYLSVGDGGTSNKARLALTTDGAWQSDGGTECDCDFSSLSDTPVLKRCTCALGATAATSVVPHVWVGNAGSDTGSLTVGHVRANMGSICEPATLGTAAVGDISTILDPSAWHSAASGGKYEVVWTPLYSGDAPDWQNDTDTIYLHDAYDSANTHLVTIIYGYTEPGAVLVRFGKTAGALTDLSILSGVTLTPGSTYATAASWRGSSSCSLAALWNTCSGSIASCAATTVQASAAGGTCPDAPAHVRVPQRYNLAVPTDAWVLALRSFFL